MRTSKGGQGKGHTRLHTSSLWMFIEGKLWLNDRPKAKVNVGSKQGGLALLVTGVNMAGHEELGVQSLRL